MTTGTLRRRELLARIGGGAALLPLLRGNQACAQGGVFPKRLIIVVLPNGYPVGDFEPTGVGNNLADLKLSTTLSALEPWKQQLNFLAPMTCPNTVGAQDFHRTYSMMFSGLPPADRNQRGAQSVWSPSGPTIDQIIGAATTERTKLPLRTLPLSVPFGTVKDSLDTKTEGMRSFWTGQGQPVTPERDPYKLVDTLFAGKTPDDPVMQRTRAERKSILDFLGRDLERFAKQLGSEDRNSVEGHLQGVRDIERQLAVKGSDSGSIDPSSTPVVGKGLDPLLMKHYPLLLNAQLDILVAALRADVTRVGTLQLGPAWGDSFGFPWLSLGGTWHDSAHHNVPRKKIIDTWFAGQFAALLKRLSDVPEVGPHSRTMLDNTIVVWSTTMLDGSHTDRLPWILAGSCGGYFKTGQFLRNAKDQPVNRVIVDIANAMDVPMTFFGDKNIQGTIAGLKA